MPSTVPSLRPLRVHCASNSGDNRIRPRIRNSPAAIAATPAIWVISEAATTNMMLTRSTRLSGRAVAGSGIAAKGVPANCTERSSASSASIIGLTRSRVTDTTNTAAIAVRNASANHSRGRDTVAAISHTGELKNTRKVSSSSGSARVTIEPAAARFVVVICTAQAMMEPAPHAVSAKMAAITTASRTRSTSTRGLGPPRMPPTIAIATATVAATVRPRTVEMRETNQPTATATGSTRTSRARTNHSVRVG